MSHEELIEKNTPNEVCPEETVCEIKKRNIEALKQVVTTQWEDVKHNPNQAEFDILIEDRIRYVDHNYKKIYINGYYARVPEKYKNGFNVIITYDDIISVIKSIVDVPHII